MGLSYNKKRIKSNRLRNSIIILVALVIILIVIAGFRTYKVYQNDLPSFEQLHNIEPSLKTKVYDRNGTLLKEFYSENRALTPLKELPDHLVQMLLASEDRDFYNHWGINSRRIFFVALDDLLNWKTAGASTITQQLSRMLFLNREKTIARKIKEALTAIKLERNFSKDEIIEMYLNQYYFSSGAYGVAAASHLFFSKNPSDLDLCESAILIGLLKGPNINSPLKNPDKCLQARNRVLYSFYDYGGITREMYDSLKNEPLKIHQPEEEIGYAPYFTETIRQYIINKYGDNVLYNDGLKVYTSLNLDLQLAAEEALYKRVDSLRARINRKYSLDNNTYAMNMPDTVDQYGDSIRIHKPVQGAFLAIDNATGDIIVMVGGRSFEESKYNRAWQSNLQPGSCFKPFLYTACIDNGFKTTDIIDDNPIVLDIPGAKQWRPPNYDSKFLGPVTIRDGLRKSRNLVAVRLILKIGPEQAIFYARNMGITTPLDPVPSLALGSGEVKLVEIVSAYSIFPNQGIHIPYRLIHKIVDRYGRVLEDNSSIQKEEVLSAQTAYIMTNMMQSTVDTGGTAVRALWMGFNRPAGGKTGTSNNFCDNWFIGYTPQITAGTWVGFDEKISLGYRQDGGTNGVPIWAQFMIAAHDSLPIVDFVEPEGIIHSNVCLESGEIATDRCIRVRDEVFIEGTEPTVTCHIHPSAKLYNPGRKIDDEFVPTDTTDERRHF